MEKTPKKGIVGLKLETKVSCVRGQSFVDPSTKTTFSHGLCHYVAQMGEQTSGDWKVSGSVLLSTC